VVGGRRWVKVCFAQGTIENSALDTAFEPQFDSLLEAGLRLSDGTSLGNNTDVRACCDTALSGVAPHEREKVDFESNRFDHRSILRVADAMPAV
jgi:hypothetical protein